MSVNGEGPTELYKRYRPRHFREIYGQPEVVQMLEDMIHRKKVPQSLLLSGKSGIGKTTISRILQRELKCSKHDFREINAASSRGIDTIRDIEDHMRIRPMGGDCRIYYLDEVHQLSRRAGGDAQTAFLKILEDTPSGVYFFLSTTDPQQLLPTIRNRCTEIKLNPLSSEVMKKLLLDVCGKEKVKITEEVVLRLIEVSEGSARAALVLLNQVMNLKSEEDQLDLIQSNDVKTVAIQICRALMNPRTKWPDMAELLKNLDEEPESVRHAVLGYASAVMLKGSGKNIPVANWIIICFEANFYDSKKAGLIRACYEVLEKRN